MTTIFSGGTILRGFGSAGGSHPLPEALAVRGGAIVASGAEALAMSNEPGAVHVDLAGGTLVPAFGDGHAHPLFGGLESLGPRIRGCASVGEIVGQVRRWAESHPELPWIYGASYDASLAPDGIFDARWLDDAVPDRPVVLRAWDYHTMWVNSAALLRAGIDANTPEPALGRILRRPDGSPVGTLQEQGAIDLVLRVASPRPLEDLVEAIRIASARYLAHGITWVQDAWVDPADLEAWMSAARSDAISVRYNLAFRVDPLRWRAQLEELPASRDRVAAEAHPLLTARTVKFFVDGVVENRTAAMLEPYSDRAGDRGLPNWGREELTRAAVAFDALGFQLHMHAIGDAGNRLALDVLEAVVAANGERDRRPVVAHVQVVHPDDLDRFARLRVIANFEPLWAHVDPMMAALTIPALGEERAATQYRIRSLLERGAPVSFGSDWPVTDLDWRPGAAVAVTRHAAADGPPGVGWMPQERLSQEAALEAYTAGVAHQAFADDGGVLDVGRRADLVHLDRDPREAEGHLLSQVRVLGTWVAGTRRYDCRDDPDRTSGEPQPTRTAP